MTSEKFYEGLPVHENFSDLTNLELYSDFSKDWTILVADVEGSTQAVAEGRYKEVNFIGASCIVAILNVMRKNSVDIPFVFGGDGATLIVPNKYLAKAWAALESTQKMARSEFDFALRIGAVPVDKVNANEKTLKVAKVKISPDLCQAMFVGGGLSYAETLVKSGAGEVQPSSPTEEVADYSGLECRWQDIGNDFGETHSWLVLALGSDLKQTTLVYKEFLEQTSQAYGQDNPSPVSAKSLKLTLNPNRLSQEIRAKNPNSTWAQRLWLHIWMSFLVVCGKFFFLIKYKTESTDWGEYRNEVEKNTDYRKFDDVMRMVLCGSPAMRERLTAYLEKAYQDKKLVYGVHVGTHAQMTCLVFSRHGQHLHFVDGSGGGYTLAAKALKERLKKMRKT